MITFIFYLIIFFLIFLIGWVIYKKIERIKGVKDE